MTSEEEEEEEEEEEDTKPADTHAGDLAAAARFMTLARYQTANFRPPRDHDHARFFI
jgi:hypothetical protein